MSEPTDSTSRPQRTFVIVGIICILLGTLACLGTLAAPTVHTFILSIFEVNILGRGAEFIGLEAYSRLFEFSGIGGAIGFTLLITIERLLMVSVAPLLLALLVNEFGRAVRIPARLLFTIPLAMFSPIVTLLAWRGMFIPRLGPLGRIEFLGFMDPISARITLLIIDGLTTFGLACGIGLIAHLAALRGEVDEKPAFKKIWRTAGVTWLISILAVIALSLQALTLVQITTGGGPINATTTPAFLQWRLTMQQFQFTAGGAIGTPTLIILGLLGLVSGAAVVFSDLRIVTVPITKSSGLIASEEGKSTGKIVAGIALALIGLAALLVIAIWALPILYTAINARMNGGFAELRSQELSLGRVFFLNTLSPALLRMLLVQLPLTVLTAFGIGAMRPLGKRSDLLLLLFSPWLFVTTGPLMYSFYLQGMRIGILNTWLALIVPMVINVPVLFILTLFFKGAAEQWQKERETQETPFARKVIVPALPLIGLIGAALLLINLQTFDWPLLTVTSRELTPMPLLIQITAAMNVTRPEMINAMLTRFGRPAAVAFFLIFAAFQVFYLDRLALVGGKRDKAEPEIDEPVDKVAESEEAPVKTPRKKKKPAEDDE